MRAEIAKLQQGDASGVYGDNATAAYEDLQKYYQQLMEELTNVKDLQDEIHQDFLDQMDEVQEKFDTQIDSYEYISGLLEHDLKLIQLHRGDDAYSEMAGYYEQQSQYDLKQLDFQRQQVAF